MGVKDIDCSDRARRARSGRVGALAAAVAASAVVATSILGTSASSAAPGDAQIQFVNGIDSTPVDVYADGALIAVDVAYGETGAAELPGGAHSIEVCAAASPAPDPLPDAGCTISAGYPDGGVPITLAGGASYAVVGQYAGTGPAIGSPTVAAYEIDVSCQSSVRGFVPGYTTFVHAATAPTVDVLYDPGAVFDDVVPQSAPQPRVGYLVPALGPVSVTVTAGDELLLEQAEQMRGETNRVLVFVGNPASEVSYDLLVADFGVPYCQAPPPTESTTTTTATTTGPAVTPVVATPRFTG